MNKDILIIGAEGIGKTTLANALLGWDIFPQSNDEIYMPTMEISGNMLADGIQLIDTPGYDYWWNQIPEGIISAISKADTIVVLLDDVLTVDGYFPSDDPDWEKHLAAEEMILGKLLGNANTKDIFFVLPYETKELSGEEISLMHSLRIAQDRFSYLTAHGNACFYCIDPLKALVGAIEADDRAIEDSGILPLKAALLK